MGSTDAGDPLSEEAGTPRSEDPSSYGKLEGRVLRNTGWVAIGLTVSQIASLVSTIVLVRLLEPEAFGLIALASTVLYLVAQIQESGVGAALIYRRGDIREAAASALVYSWAVGILLYGIGFATAPLAASFLHADELTPILRVMALMLVFRSLGAVPDAILERNLDFRSKTVAQLAGTVAQVGVVMSLAFAGLGVWSLVAGNVAGAAVDSATAWIRVPWRPSPWLATRRALKELLRYGRFVGATNILGVISNTVDNIAVGRLLGTTATGYYVIAFRLADFPTSVIGHVMGRTMFSVYSRLQGDVAALREAYLRNLERIALLALPASVGLVVAARPLVLTLLGEKWLPVVTPLRILAVYGLIKPFGGATVEALKGIGKPHVPLIFGIVYAATVTPALFVLTPRFGLNGAALSMLIAISVTTPPQCVVYMRSVHLSVRDLARALGPPILSASILAAALVLLVNQSSSMPPGRSLALIASVGFGVYVVATAACARNAIRPIWLSLRRVGDDESPTRRIWSWWRP